MKRATQGIPFDHGIEKNNVGRGGLAENEVCIGHFVDGATDGDEVGEDEVGVVESVAEEMGVDGAEIAAGLVAVEEMEDSAFHCLQRRASTSAHVCTELLCAGSHIKGLTINVKNCRNYYIEPY